MNVSVFSECTYKVWAIIVSAKKSYLKLHLNKTENKYIIV